MSVRSQSYKISGFVQVFAKAYRLDNSVFLRSRFASLEHASFVGVEKWIANWIADRLKH
jgi:hypothetical protein